MKKIFLLIVFFSLFLDLFAQKAKSDSLAALLTIEKTDTGKVKLMYLRADVMSVYDPANALLLAQKALNLSIKIKYTEGESKALGIQANAFLRLGNYAKALEANLHKLKLEEKRNSPRNLAFALLNTGIVYSYQKDYQQAMKYYYKADSVFKINDLTDLQYFSMMNLGDVYDKLNNLDSSFNYFNRALILSNNLKNNDYIGNAMTGLGHTYRKQGNFAFSLLNYKTAIGYLQTANNDDVLCEATLGLAKLFELNKALSDSAIFYAKTSFAIAEKDGFINNQLEVANFLTNMYKKSNNVDSAFYYLNKVQLLNDSINSVGRVRELQAMTSNEQLRQMEMEESKKAALKERKLQLQYLFIAIFIPGFFLLTLFLSRIRIHTRAIKILGILSLLILFEYLTLLLHPFVSNLTNHTPVLEMLIFVSFAALVIPIHHRAENWFIKKLTHRNDESIRLKKVKLRMKNPGE